MFVTQDLFCAKFAPDQWQLVIATYACLHFIHHWAERLGVLLWDLHVVNNQLVGLLFQIQVEGFVTPPNQLHAWFLSEPFMNTYGLFWQGTFWLIVHGLWEHMMIASISQN